MNISAISPVMTLLVKKGLCIFVHIRSHNAAQAESKVPLCISRNEKIAEIGQKVPDPCTKPTNKPALIAKVFAVQRDTATSQVGYRPHRIDDCRA
jgi:hypothetical protein